MYKLRDGSTVDDPRIDRLIDYDPRSKQYPIRTLVEAKPRRSYTWRCNQNLDQGSDGACVGFGISHELIARPSEVQGLTDKFAKEQIYWEAQKIDQWDGGSYPGANPVYEGTSTLAGMKIACAAGWFDEYRWAFNFEDLVLGVGYNGPAVAGLMWYEGMFDTDTNGYITPTGRLAGGHCVLIRAVNVKHEFFTIRNSWGEGWGIGGDCFISFADMEDLLHENGEACFAVHRHREVA